MTGYGSVCTSQQDNAIPIKECPRSYNYTMDKNIILGSIHSQLVLIYQHLILNK